MKSEASSIAARVRSLRRRENMSQVQLAERLSISPGYLNLIEHNRRPLTASLLIKLAQIFQLDLQAFSPEGEARLSADLLEVFGDAVFESQDITTSEVRDLVVQSPTIARALLTLYQAYRSAQESADTLAMKLSEGEDLPGIDRSRLPTEEVNDLIQHHGNHFAELEEGAETVWRRAGLSIANIYDGLVRYLQEVEGVEVRVETVGAMRGALRRYDPERRVLTLSEVLRRGSRNFQVAHQLGLLTQRPVLDRIARDASLTGEAEEMARVALANYFAGAVLMPYEPFLEAARSERYDIVVLSNRFRTSFEQICHRLTTLRRPGAEGVPFHFVRIDVAGNISKRFSASGFRFARFSGACPRWNVFAAFLTPGMIRTSAFADAGRLDVFLGGADHQEGHRRLSCAAHRVCGGDRLRCARRAKAGLCRRRQRRQSRGRRSGRCHLSPLRPHGLRTTSVPSAPAPAEDR